MHEIMIFKKLYHSEFKAAFEKYLSDETLSEILNDIAPDERSAFKFYLSSKTSKLKSLLNRKFPTIFPLSEQEHDALVQVNSLIMRHINKD